MLGDGDIGIHALGEVDTGITTAPVSAIVEVTWALSSDIDVSWDDEDQSLVTWS